jgi:hypothetical protein
MRDNRLRDCMGRRRDETCAEYRAFLLKARLDPDHAITADDVRRPTAGRDETARGDGRGGWRGFGILKKALGGDGEVPSGLGAAPVGIG